VRRTSPLHAAVVSRNVKIARLLLLYGADVNATTSTGDTPLIRAVQEGWVATKENRTSRAVERCYDMVKMLLRRGADAHLKNDKGVSARDLAASADEKMKALFGAESLSSSDDRALAEDGGGSTKEGKEGIKVKRTVQKSTKLLAEARTESVLREKAGTRKSSEQSFEWYTWRSG